MGEGFGLGSQMSVKFDRGSAAGDTVEECAGGDGDAENFFEAEGLGAELHFVAGVGLGFTALVFDGEGCPPAGAAFE